MPGGLIDIRPAVDQGHEIVFSGFKNCDWIARRLINIRWYESGNLALASLAGCLKQDISERLIVALRKVKLFLLWNCGILAAFLKIKTNWNFPPRNAYKSANAKQPRTKLNKVKSLMSKILEEERLSHIVVEQLAKNLFVLNSRECK